MAIAYVTEADFEREVIKRLDFWASRREQRRAEEDDKD